MSRADELRALLARVEEGRPCLAMDRAIHNALCLGNGDSGWCPAPYTSSLNCAKQIVSERLPGFWHSTTTCWRTADADLAPDFTGPHGDDLLAAGWNLEEHDAVTFSAVVAPGGPIHAECLALIAATLKALIAREGLTPPSPEVLAERRAALAAMKAQVDADPARPALLSALISQEAENGR